MAYLRIRVEIVSEKHTTREVTHGFEMIAQRCSTPDWRRASWNRKAVVASVKRGKT